MATYTIRHCKLSGLVTYARVYGEKLPLGDFTVPSASNARLCLSSPPSIASATTSLNSSFVYSSSIRNSPSTSNPSCHHSAVPGTQSLPSTPSPPRTSPLPPHSRLSSLAPESRPQYPSPISLCTRLALPLSVEWWLLLEEKEKKDDGVKVEDVAPPPPPLLGAVVDVPCEGERWKTLRSQERVRWRREMLVPGEEVAVLDDGVGDGMAVVDNRDAKFTQISVFDWWFFGERAVFGKSGVVEVAAKQTVE
ncbi:hypothetical protein BKA81DRAFT_416092 [Phyllosticta paracitricarpa]